MKLTKQNSIYLIIIGLVALIAIVCTVYAKHARNNAIVDTIQVEVENPHLKFVQQETIEELLKGKIDSITKKKAKDINLLALEQKIDSNIYVEKCQAYIDNKNKLHFIIKQKEPLFRVINNFNIDYYIGKRGEKFPKTLKFTANVPLAFLDAPYRVDSLGQQKNEELEHLITFFTFLEENQTAKALVTMAKVEDNGDISFVPRTGKHVVIIGEPTQLEKKFNRLFYFYKEGLSRVGWDEYSLINLKYDHQVIAKKKKG